MIYVDRRHAESARFYLNNVKGFAPAYIYRCGRGYTVVRIWNAKREFCANGEHYMLDD